MDVADSLDLDLKELRGDVSELDEVRVTVVDLDWDELRNLACMRYE